MTNKAGLTILGDAGDIKDALALGCSTYLLIHDGTKSVEYAHQIKERYPDAEVLIRRYGGVSNDARDVAEQCVQVLEPYWRLGIRHIIGWNEPDRGSEGGWSPQAVGSFAWDFYGYLHSLLPQARIHFPAFTMESAYNFPAQDFWVDAARQFDDIDLHAYGRGAVARYLQWAESFLPGKPTWVTEYNYGLGNPRPADYGAEIVDTVTRALTVPQCQSVVLFTWNWPGAEPGGEALCVKDDWIARGALRAASQMEPDDWSEEEDEEGELTPPITLSLPPLDRAFALFGDIFNEADSDEFLPGRIMELALEGQRAINQFKESVG